MKRPDELNTYEYLSIHLMGKRRLYEKSFALVKEHTKALSKFRSLTALMVFFRQSRPEETLPVKEALFRLDKEKPSLRPQIVEVLMLVMWDELEREYGTHDGFRNSYWDLIQELESRR
ncbi:MAG: hypothetical protein HY811_06340 [Planctomycetes bacterium]|nr:hypothetical protein [Planctomycetota bacterium]